MNDRAARALFRRSFAEQLESVATLPTDPLKETGEVIRFRGASSAVVKSSESGERALVVSDVPFRNEDGETLDNTLLAHGEGFVPRASLAEVKLPGQADGWYEFPSVGVSFKVEGEESPGVLLDAGTGASKDMVFYGNTGEDADSAAIATVGGLETFTQLRSPAAPRRIRLSYRLPDGAKLVETLDGGAIVVDGDGKSLLTIHAPFAIDAEGRDVPLSLSVEGRSLVIDVEHRDRGFAYPIMVDPVQETRDWFNNGAYPGFQGWAASEYGTSNYRHETSCPSVLASSECGGTGAGLYVSAVPSLSYPASSSGWWTWTAPGGASTSITGVTVNSWRYRKGASTNHPYAVMSTGNIGSSWTTTAGSGGSGLTFSGSSASGATKFFRFGLTSPAASTIPAGAANYRYFRLAAYSLSLVDSDEPTVTFSGLPSQWLGGATNFSFNAIAADPGLGLAKIRTQVNAAWTTNWSSSCTGTYGSECPKNITTNITLSTNSFDTGFKLIPVMAHDVLGGYGHESAGAAFVKVDKKAPSLTMSGSLTDENSPGGQLTFTATDNTLNGATYDSQGEVTDPIGFGEYGRIESGTKKFEVFVDNASVYSTNRVCTNTYGSCRIGPLTTHVDLTSLEEGTHEIKVVATDQVGNKKTQTWNKFVEQVSPGVKVTDTPSGWVTGDELDLGVVAVDDGHGIAEISVKKDGLEVGSRSLSCHPTNGCPPSFSGSVTVDATALEEGVNELEVEAVGPAEDAGVPAKAKVKIDRVNPDIEDLVSAGWMSDAGKVQVKASNPGSGISQITVRGPANQVLGSLAIDCEQGCPESVDEAVELDNTALAEGSRVATVTVAGDVSARKSTDDFTFSVDRTAPRLNALSGSLTALAGTLSTRDDVVSVSTGAGDDQGTHNSGLATVSASDDELNQWSDSNDCTSSSCASLGFDVPLGELGDGEQSIVVTATDLAGNETSRQVDFALDRRGPEVKISPVNGSQGWVSSTDLEFEVTITDVPSEGGLGVESSTVEVDGQPVAAEPCDSECDIDRYLIPGISEGAHTIEVVAEDHHGHVTTTTQEVTVDRVEPEVDISGDFEDDAVVDGDATELRVEAGEPSGSVAKSGVTRIKVLVDDEEKAVAEQECAAGDCSMDETFEIDRSVMGFGLHRLQVVVGDLAGNEKVSTLNVRRSCEVPVPAAIATTDPLSAQDAIDGIESNHAQLLEPASPVEIDGVELQPTLTESGDVLNTEGTLQPSQVEASPAGEMVAGQGESSVCLVPDRISTEADDAELVNEDAAVYANTDQDTDTLVRPTVDGLESYSILRSEDAPEEFEWTVNGGPDASLVEEDGGGVAVVKPASELEVPERPIDIPAEQGLAEDLVTEGLLPAGTVDADPDPLGSAEQEIKETVAERPEDDVIEDELPSGGPASVPPAPPAGPDPDLEAAKAAVALADEEAEQAREDLVDDEVAEVESDLDDEVDDSLSRAEDEESDAASDLESADATIARIKAPLAEDADGEEVPVAVEASGDRIAMSVEHRGEDVEYPIAVDPWVVVQRQVVEWESFPVYKWQTYVSGKQFQLRQVGWWNAKNCKLVRCVKGDKAGWWKVPNGYRVWMPGGMPNGGVGPKYEGFWKPVKSKRKVFSHWGHKKVLKTVTEKVWQEDGDLPDEVQDALDEAFWEDPEEFADEPSFDDDAMASISRSRKIPSSWFAGMNVVAYQKNAYKHARKKKVGTFVALRKEQGTDTAVLVPVWYVKSNQDTSVAKIGWKSPSDASIKSAAKAARNQGKMRVILKPHVDALNDKSRTELTFASNPGQFWRTYRKMMVHYAKLAKKIRARGLVVGTELSMLQGNEAQWKKTLAAIKDHYCPGPSSPSKRCNLYYAANWDAIGNPPSWWRQLDGVGVDYYPSDWGPSSEKDQQGRYYKDTDAMYGQLRSFHNHPVMRGKKVFFTESGAVTWKKNGKPAENRPRGYSQAGWYERMFDSALKFKDQDRGWFKGFWWWDRYTLPASSKDPQYSNYTPNGATVKVLCRYQCK